MSGGGGGGLTLSVKAYETLPETEKENTIAVITAMDIPNFVIISTEPQTKSTGTVWINTDGGGVSVAIDEDGIVTLFPAVCKQWDGSSWLGCDAYVYQNGVWVQFAADAPVYFDDGDEFVGITGGWTTDIFTNSARPNKGAVSITNTLNINTANGNQAGILGTANKVDLTDVEAIYYVCTTSSGSPSLSVLSGTDVQTEKVATKATPLGSGSLDVSSLSGKYYIAVWIAGSSSSPDRSASYSYIGTVDPNA